MRHAKFLNIVFVGLITLPFAVYAAVFNVTNVTEFQTALNTAQANGESDTISVAVGVYNVATTLTYTAVAAENFPLTINGFDSDFVILDGATLVPILRIDTTAVTSDDSVAIALTNMTFQNGNAVGTPFNGGALAIVMDDATFPPGLSVSVTGSEFYDNGADGDGGAIYIRGDAALGMFLADLTIEDNVARGIAGGSDGDGGGAYVAGGTTTDVSITDIDFFGNMALVSGGGLVIEGASSGVPLTATMFDILLFNNQITGMTGDGGGASVSAGTLFCDMIGFVDNTATRLGGGLHLAGNTQLLMTNSGMVGNQAVDGGGIGTELAQNIDILVRNSSLSGNTASNQGGGAFISRFGTTVEVSFYNNILWGNNGIAGADVYVNDDPNDLGGMNVAEVQIINNDIADLDTKCTLDAGCTDLVLLMGNINADPLFVDLAARPEANPRLMAGSPAIDAGLNSGHPSFPPVVVDFEGDTRPFDGDGDTVATIDMGMDERVGCPANLVIANQTLSGTQTLQASSTATLGPNLIVNGTNIVVNAPLISFVNGVQVTGTFGAGNTTTCA